MAWNNDTLEGPPKRHTYSEAEILELQQCDSDISLVLSWLSQSTDRPDANLVVDESSETQSLVATCLLKTMS